MSNNAKNNNEWVAMKPVSAKIAAINIDAPKEGREEEGILNKIHFSFEMETGSVVWLNRNFYADSAKNADLKSVLYKLGVKGDTEEVIGNEANITPERNRKTGELRVAFVNHNHAYERLKGAKAKAIIKRILA